MKYLFLRRAAVLLVAFLLGPQLLAAQVAERINGFTVGRTASQQLWKPTVVGADRTGILLGLFGEVPLPGRVFRIRAEGNYVQRGGLVSGDFEGVPLNGEVRSEYLSFVLQVKFARSLGPVYAFIAAGPTLERLLRTRQDALLAQVLEQERDPVFNAAASGGVGFRISPALIVEVEARWVRGLSPAYSGSFLTVKNRSLELLLRVGRLSG